MSITGPVTYLIRSHARTNGRKFLFSPDFMMWTRSTSHSTTKQPSVLPSSSSLDEEGNVSLHHSLREHVRLLGDNLGRAISNDLGEEFVDRIEKIRSYAKRDRQDHPEGREKLIEYLRSLPEPLLFPIARAFNQFLNLSNIAEQHHRARFRRIEDYRPGTRPRLIDVLNRIREAGHNPRKVLDTLATMRIELVLTAHPTEVIRRTLIQTYDMIDDCLGQLETNNENHPERAERIRRRLEELINQAWHTNEFRRERPTPVDEARWGFAVIESSLWQAVPDFYRDLDHLLLESTGERLPLDATPIRFASWMGGDRDGNPNVTADVTQEVLLQSRWQAADLYLKDLAQLKNELSMWKATSELKNKTGDVAEPYRELMKRLIQRMSVTRAWIKAQLEGKQFHSDIPVIKTREQLHTPLLLCYRSLCESNLDILANGALLDTMRRIACFGVTLTKLDLRQESSRHSQVLEELIDYLYGDDYTQWDEDKRQTFLLEELGSKRPLIPYRWKCSPESEEVLKTFKIISQDRVEGLGTYVISMARQPSDVLTVALLMKEMAGDVRLPIAPLFETLEDLNRSGDVIKQLLGLPGYRSLINDRQEVMIGYSDSAKDAGQLAAAWAQYRAQERLVEICKEQNVTLTLFHGRGGTVGRGGGPAHAAILSQPPGSVNNNIRVTEQGEMIRFKFGQAGVAVLSMEIYVCAVLEASLLPLPQPKSTWREEMNKLADRAHHVYNSIVREDPNFVSYFHAITPLAALARLPLGSRPAKRKQGGGVETLRAIPWIFAWTQIRLMLPAWLGSTETFDVRLKQEGGLECLREMIEQWPFFRMYFDMLEMVLAKADVEITEYYEQRLVNEPSLKRLGKELRQRLDNLNKIVLHITDQQQLLEHAPLLYQTIMVRNPYIDPLHGLQAELLHRCRKEDKENKNVSSDINRALMVTMAGIAAGLRNTA